MPASAETANTGAGKEDHVSMGGFSARKAVQVSFYLVFFSFFFQFQNLFIIFNIFLKVIENVQKILAIELLAATQAIHHRRRIDPSFQIPEKLNILYQDCSVISPPMEKDRYLKSDYEGLLHYIKKVMPYKSELINPK